jgi:hypothetical protein
VRRRWPVLLLLASGLTFLASLYLPWQGARPAQPPTDPLGILEGQFDIDGWGGTGLGFGSLAAVLALALVVASGVTLAQAARVPLAPCGLLVGYAAAAVAVDTWYERRYVAPGADVPLRFHFAYGAYLGLAAGAAAVLGAVGLRSRLPVRSLIAGATALALLIALALPWARVASLDLSAPGYVATASAGVVVAAVFLPAAALLFCGGMVRRARADDRSCLRRVDRAWLCGPAVRPDDPASAARRHRDGGWSGPVRRNALLSLAWIVGWSLLGTAAAGLALALIAFPAAMLELAVAFALLVATDGFELAAFTPSGYGLRLAAKLGFASAAVLFGLVLFRSRALRPATDRLPLRACAVLAVFAYLALTLVPIWHVLSDGWTSALVFIAPSWLGIAGVVLAVRLAGAWLRPTVEAGVAALIPLVLLALVALWLIEKRTYNVNWGGRIVVAVLLLLALLGRLEQRGGLENFRVPELLRFDRL